MSQSLREGGGAISKFYICRAYKLCPAIRQSGAAVAREAHNLEVAGSSPASASRGETLEKLYIAKAPSLPRGCFCVLDKIGIRAII